MDCGQSTGIAICGENTGHVVYTASTVSSKCRSREILPPRTPDEVTRETIWLVSPPELASTRAVRVTSTFVAQPFRTEARALAE